MQESQRPREGSAWQDRGTGQREASEGMRRCPSSLWGLICSVGRRLPALQGLRGSDWTQAGQGVRGSQGLSPGPVTDPQPPLGRLWQLLDLLHHGCPGVCDRHQNGQDAVIGKQLATRAGSPAAGHGAAPGLTQRPAWAFGLLQGFS